MILLVLLLRISLPLALVVLLGVPLLLLIIGPLLGRLHGTQGRYRDVQAELTARISDVVGGLGVLSALGGKDQRNTPGKRTATVGAGLGSVGGWRWVR